MLLGPLHPSEDVATLSLSEGNYLLFATFGAQNQDISEGYLECILGDQSYNVHLAGVDAPGDNIPVTLTSFITLTTNGTAS